MGEKEKSEKMRKSKKKLEKNEKQKENTKGKWKVLKEMLKIIDYIINKPVSPLTSPTISLFDNKEEHGIGHRYQT